MMPGLFAILLILALYACVTGDFQQAWHFLFHFQYTELNRTVLVDALGHAFFSLALGAGCMLAYGTYLPPRTSIVHSVCIIAALDVLVAILSGLAIFPIVFQYHLPPDAGPDLMFKTLPIAFAQMPGGFLIGGLFFILLTFAAWTSSISLAEPLVMIGIERLKWTRIKACMIVGAMAWVLGIGCVLSFNYWAAFKPLAYCGIQGNYFDVITDFTTNLLLPLGGILFAIFTGWKLNPEILQETLALQLNHFKIWYFLIRYLVPIGIGIILIHGVL
jgi:NSS family neurotransmitter:Na+ symporter